MRRENTIALVPLALVAAAVAAPLLARDHLLIAYFLRRCFALVCHQDPQRSFWLAGAPIAICVRCLGIYLGASMGTFVRVSRAWAMRLCALAAAANLLDVAAESIGLYGNHPLPRFLLGVAAGIALGALLRAAITEERFPLPAASASL